jgi:hypothetical protein
MSKKKSKVQEVIDKVIGTKEQEPVIEKKDEQVQEQPIAQSKATDYNHKELPSLLALRKKFGK